MVSVLNAIAAERGLPGAIQCDQGTEFTSTTVDQWAYWNRVRLDFSRPGKPGDNAVNEAFNGIVRRECLSQHYFLDAEEARRVLEAWRMEYNNERPHGSLDQLAPVRFHEAWCSNQGPSDVKNCVSGGPALG